MNRLIFVVQWLTATLCLSLIAACGGGGGGGGDTGTSGPSITAAPISASVAAGQSSTFTVAAGGTGPFTYQWQRDGVNIAGATSASYTVASPGLADNNAQFRVVVSNGSGSTTSAAAVLTVSPLLIATQPTSTSVPDGTAATLTVVPAGQGPFTYQWRSVANNVSTNVAGATSASFTTPQKLLGDPAVTYNVVVSNALGSTTSNNATVTVVAGPPVIGSAPQTQAVLIGAPVTFSVLMGSTGPFTYQWQRNGVNIAGATSATYGIVAQSADNDARYRVVVTNAQGTTTSAEAILTVTATAIAPSIVQQPQDVTVRVGERATFTIVIAGTGPFQFELLTNGVVRTQDTYTQTTLTHQIVILSVTIADHDNTTHSLRVTNAAGSVTSRAALLRVLP